MGKHVFIAVIYLIFLPACTNQITPPHNLDEPVQAYLVDHGRHPSLILTRSDGSLVRYAYGDWRWYALGKESIWGAMHAMAWPSQGALGRREFPNETRSLQRGGPISEGFSQVYPFLVERQKSEDLQRRLDAKYGQKQDTMVFNPRYGLEFVHHPRRYWLAHHSNRVMGFWLRDLGCQVKGSLLFSEWQMNFPAP